jgi:hypothetical protein
MTNLTTMVIPISKLIAEHNEKTGERMTKASLARELVKHGDYKSEPAARNAMAYMESGKAKGLDKLLYMYLCERFHKNPGELYQTKL